jgi:hypothetical protein
MGLDKRYIQIAGSTKESVDREVLARSHAAVRALVTGVLKAGGGLIVGAGEDLRLDASNPSTARLFDWTVLDEVERFSRALDGVGKKMPHAGALVITSQKNLSRIPETRRAGWEYLVGSKAIAVRPLEVDWSAAAYIRQHQAAAGHGLVILGGGEGVEHSASLYVERGRVVVPLDADLGAFYGDGTGGARRLYNYALSRPERFVLRDAQDYGASLQLISLNGSVDTATVAGRVVALLERFATPHAFCVRLLNPAVDVFSSVQNFFDNTVRPGLGELGFRDLEMGRAAATEAFINSEIFELLHYADVAVADLTGLRPNNFLEAGYALGRPLPVIFTAMEGTVLPFDTQAVPTFFWKRDETDVERKRKFLEHWRLYVNRPSIVRRRELG